MQTEPSASTPRSLGLLRELKRRRVVRTALAYAGSAFVLLEGSELVLNALEVPEVVLRVMVIVALLGFPVAVSLSWLFDVTADGLRLTGRGAGRGRLVAAFDPRRMALAAAGVLLCAMAVAGMLRVAHTRAAVAAPAERATLVAVLPFSISGTMPGVLGEGIVELLTRNLDEVGTLRTVEPRRIYRAWGRSAPGGPLTLAEAHELAEATGAELIVTGSVVPVGEEIRLNAEVHTLSGERLGAVRVDGPSASFLRLVDELSISLLREVWRTTRPIPGLSLEGVTTGSLEAIRSYLSGERLYRNAAWGPAMEAFERAVAADPEFALAHFRVLGTAFWLNDEARTHEALAVVMGMVDRLPERERTLARALELEIQGNNSAAIDTLGAYVARFPDDPEGWFRMADNVFHLQETQAGPLERPTARDLWMFDEVLQRDPAFTMALVHPLEVAFELADTALIARYLRLLEGDAPAAAVYRRAQTALRSPGQVQPLVDALYAAIEARAGPQNLEWQAGRAVLRPLQRLVAVQPAETRARIVEQLGERLDAGSASWPGLATRLHLIATTGRMADYSALLANPAVRMNLGAGNARVMSLLPVYAGLVDPATLPDSLRGGSAHRAAVEVLRALDARDRAALRVAVSRAAALRPDSLATLVAGAGEGFVAVLSGDPAGGLRQVEDALRQVDFLQNVVVEALWFRWLEHAVEHEPSRARIAPVVERPWAGLPVFEVPRLLLLARLRDAAGDREGAARAYAAYLAAAPEDPGEDLGRRRLQQARDAARRLRGVA